MSFPTSSLFRATRLIRTEQYKIVHILRILRHTFYRISSTKRLALNKHSTTDAQITKTANL